VRKETLGTKFVTRPFVKPESLEERHYQLELADICSKENTLAVLPTGLGKTAIALLAIANFLSKDPNSSSLVLAPTRVLVHQHHSFLGSHLTLPADQIGVLTGEDPIAKRREVWSKLLVCATPQIVESDVHKGLCDLSRFCFIVFDEVHRAVGDYAYGTIASTYTELRKDARILGMTASLPTQKEKADEIVTRLKISRIEARDEKSTDVKPYIFKTGVQWVELDLSSGLKEIQQLVKYALNSRLELLEAASLVKRKAGRPPSLKDLLALRMKIDQIPDPGVRSALFSSIRLLHALNLVETQSLAAFRSFMERLIERKRGYGMNELLNDSRVKLAFEKTNSALARGEEHPKIEEVLKLARTILPGERAIVFASYRDSVNQIYSVLAKNGFSAGFLIGKSGQSGQTQKSQVKALEALRDGVYDILVATQVGEEGLDVADCNLVIFYDNVPSAVRFIQRKGRTGRQKEGRICVLLAKGTKDEAYYWMMRRRLREHSKETYALTQRKQEDVLGPMDLFLKEEQREKVPSIAVDTRESSEFVEGLRRRGALVEIKQLDIGDFVVSSDLVIERKTLDDFVKSIYDGRLFRQMVNMQNKYTRPILLIQGEKKELIGIGEAAFYGALSSVLSDFRVPIFFASNEKEVVEIIFHLARREQFEKNRGTALREGRKPASLSDTQRYIVAGIPGVSSILADRLLSKLETVENLFLASELELSSVEGIGDVLATRIRRLARAKYVPSANPAELQGESLAGEKIETLANVDSDVEIPVPPSDD
jgi:ERCC4-related helicase